jgi:uncharacterized radical SAM superfamily Fe-S cluster-containing enzyme
MNRALCNTCTQLVDADTVERDGKVFLVKECSVCGTTETLISNDASRYAEKRSLDAGFQYVGCALNCVECRHKMQPSFIFLDITNRCNLNCPICINNTPSMGFVFEPPIEYFDKIFAHFAGFDPPPAVQLFGGEPTVRKDMFEIIEMAQSYGLPVRVVTNGIKLADEDFCRKLVETRATILIAYDGKNPDTYKVLRGSETALTRKQLAMENLRKIGGAKVAFMTCIAKGFNDGELPEILALCHDLRDIVRGIYFLPLAQTWDTDEFDLEPDRMTSEDIELMLDDCFEGERIEFVPAGIMGSIPTLRRYLKIKHTPFMGAHPNCESLYLLVSDGERYVPLTHYLRGSLPDLFRALFELEERFEAKEKGMEKGVFGRLMGGLRLRRAYLAMRAKVAVFRALRRHARIGLMLRGRGLTKAWHMLGVICGLMIGRKSRVVFHKHTYLHEVLQIIVLPFEDNSTLETQRLERCPNAFVFYDPQLDEVKSVPTCAWGLHKKRALRLVTEHYAAAQASD